MKYQDNPVIADLLRYEQWYEQHASGLAAHAAGHGDGHGSRPASPAGWLASPGMQVLWALARSVATALDGIDPVAQSGLIERDAVLRALMRQCYLVIMLATAMRGTESLARDDIERLLHTAERHEDLSDTTVQDILEDCHVFDALRRLAHSG